jgi:hypothetical protein
MKRCRAPALLWGWLLLSPSACAGPRAGAAAAAACCGSARARLGADSACLQSALKSASAMLHAASALGRRPKTSEIAAPAEHLGVRSCASLAPFRAQRAPLWQRTSIHRAATRLLTPLLAAEVRPWESASGAPLAVPWLLLLSRSAQASQEPVCESARQSALSRPAAASWAACLLREDARDRARSSPAGRCGSGRMPSRGRPAGGAVRCAGRAVGPRSVSSCRLGAAPARHGLAAGSCVMGEGGGSAAVVACGAVVLPAAACPPSLAEGCRLHAAVTLRTRVRVPRCTCR